MCVPNVQVLVKKSLKDFTYLTITEVSWSYCYSLSFKFSDWTCKAGSDDNFSDSYTFTHLKKITKIEVIIHESEK